MDFKNIQTFLRVAELESFTQAAKAMSYVQSAVTMQIQQMERELGFPLFDRIGKHISLTPMGKEFLIYANEVSHIIQRIQMLGTEPEKIRGFLRVGLLESLLFSTMIDVLPAYRKKYTNIDIQLKMGQASELLALLKQNQLDMIYISGRRNSNPDLCCCYERKEHLIFVASPAHPLAQKHRVSLEELFAYPFIVTEHSGICYGRLCELAADHNLVLYHSLMVDSTVAIAGLLCRDVALSFLPEYSVLQPLNKGELVRVDVDIEPQVYYSQILYHKSKWISPFMEAMISFIREARPEA